MLKETQRTLDERMAYWRARQDEEDERQKLAREAYKEERLRLMAEKKLRTAAARFVQPSIASPLPG